MRIMNKDSIKYWLRKTFIRDINLPKNSFIYLLLSFFAIIIITEVLLFKYVVLTGEEFALDLERITILIVVSLSFLASGCLVDKIKNKTRFYNITLLICIIGLFLTNFTGTIFDYIGLFIILLSLPQLVVLWFTTLIHETNILNRGRITAFLIISCSILGLIGIAFIFFEFLYPYLFIVETVLLIIIALYSRSYKYIETEERLISDEKYMKIIFEKHFFRYSSSFTVLSFILGDLLARYGFDLDIIAFSITSFFYLLAAGWFLDNIGRKYAIVLGILVLSFFLISYGSFVEAEVIYGIPKKIYLSIHYGFSITPLLLAIFTVSGDFSTERGNLKYRGRINGLLISLMFIGIVIGYVFSKWINGLYNANPDLNLIIPEFPDRINSFLLVILLVWMMGMKEFLVSKELQWASTIKNLYLFNYDGICLYFHNLEKDEKSKIKIEKFELDEDLISGGLTGVITIISEITKSKKQLRKIEKEGVNLFFSYGKYHIAALISSMDLPILLKKLDDFSKEFEQKFEKELKNFKGHINPFNPTNYLVKKYFVQKYSVFME